MSSNPRERTPGPVEFAHNRRMRYLTFFRHFADAPTLILLTAASRRTVATASKSLAPLVTLEFPFASWGTWLQ